MKNFKIGLQLYSVREDLAKDFEGTLKKVKEMGYDYVEFAGYLGKTAEEIRKILDEIGLTAVSVHQTYLDVLDKPETVDFIKTLGAKYYAMPWMPAENCLDAQKFNAIIADMQDAGQILKDAGIQFCYHNHDFEFAGKIDGKYALDYLYATVPADILETEIDTCWVRYAGLDPAKYLKQYKGRAHIVHLKDFICKNFAAGPVYDLIGDSDEEAKKPISKEEAGFQFMPVGSGIQDIPAIIAAAEEAGAEILIVEQDQAVTATPLECAKISREYLKTLGL